MQPRKIKLITLEIFKLPLSFPRFRIFFKLKNILQLRKQQSFSFSLNSVDVVDTHKKGSPFKE